MDEIQGNMDFILEQYQKGEITKDKFEDLMNAENDKLNDLQSNLESQSSSISTGTITEEDATKTDEVEKEEEKGTGVDGNPMKALQPSTIKSKGSDKILVDTGQMRNLDMQRATPSNQVVTLFPGKKRKRGKVTNQQIGGFHQFGDGVPKRKWFGISREAEKKAMKAIELRIDRILRRL